jgi:ABC-type transport system substrate-binding protein
MNTKNVVKVFRAIFILMLMAGLIGMPDNYVRAQEATNPPYFEVVINDQQIHCSNWPMSATLTLTIDDPSNGTGIDYTDTEVVGVIIPPDESFAMFELAGFFEINAGDIVTVTDGSTVMSHIIKPLMVTDVNQTLDTISGTSQPGAQIQVYDGDDYLAWRWVTVDGAGHWSVNFSVPGPNPGEDGLYDIHSDSRIWVRYGDPIGAPYNAATQVSWHEPYPKVEAWPEIEDLHISNWPLGVNLTFVIEDPATPISPDLTFTQEMQASPWGPGTWMIVGLGGNPYGFDLQPGHIVTVSGPGISKTHIVTQVHIASVDIQTDVVTGTAAPDSNFEINAYDVGPVGPRHVIADENGDWSVDFSSGAEPIDIIPGIYVYAQQFDEDADDTEVLWNVLNPGIISGTVRDESGTPITGTTISVAAQSPDGEIYNWADSNPVDGTYTINNLPLNTNMLIVVDGNDVYGGEYYEESVLRSLATVFNLTEAAPTYSNIDFTLPPAIPVGVLEQLTFNVRVGRVLNDPIIRKAIAYGTDRERILNAAWLGNSDMYGMALNSLMAPSYWSQPAYNQVNIYPYNPAQANAILDAAGIIDNDNNGIRETVGGGDIVLDFKTTDAAFRAASSAIFVENMVAIGIQVNVTLVPSDVFFSNDPAISPLLAGDFDIAEFAWGVNPLNLDDCYPMALYRTGNFQNHGGYSNATVDAEFDAAMAATDRVSMLPHVLAYYAEVTDDMPSLPLFSRENITPVTTTSGTNVLADLSSVGVRVTFQNATSGGRTAAYASAIHPNDLPLNNTRVAVYEIGSSVTMATGTGATVCVNYDDSGLTLANENKLQLHHLTMTDTRKWTNISTSRNTTTNQVCGFANSFSTFAVLLPVNMSRTFYSTASQDGWILESSETSNLGRTMNATAATLSLGDNNQKKQYRSILSFKTSGLPDDATITKVTLKLKHSSVTPAGTNPITLLQGIYVDLRNGFFGTSSALQLTDFNAPASKTVGPFKPVLTAGWYTVSLNSTTFASINKLASNGGLTQIRLRFKLDDNNDAIANMLNLVSGNNANPVNRPTLLIEYYVP